MTSIERSSSHDADACARQSIAEAALRRRHFHGLDAIRGVAALLVALRHIPFLRVLSPAESFLAVDLFFLLSGVVLCDAYEARLRSNLSWHTFTALRLIRLYPLYILGTLLGLAAIAVGYPAPHGDLRTITLLAIAMLPYSHKDLFPLDLPAWSLFFEIIANVVYAVLARRGSAQLLLGVILISAIGLVVGCALQPHHVMDVGWKPSTMLGGFVRVGFSFSTGILLRHIFERSQSWWGRLANWPMTAWAVLVILIGIFVAEPPESWRGPFELSAILIVFPALVLTMLHCKTSGLARYVFTTLGRVSYPLYVLHLPASRIVAAVAARYDLPLATHPLWSGFIFISSMIALCLWLETAFDRPLRARLQALFESENDAARHAMLTPRPRAAEMSHIA